MTLQTTTGIRRNETETRNPEAMSPTRLARENTRFAGTGGVSEGNRSLGFRPGFRDSRTGRVYASRFADGRPAPFHLLDGLPPHLISRYTESGRAIEAVGALESGFLADDRFLTREQAARALMH